MSDTVTTTETRCDVLVIGGGPAGSTISALLAQRGRDVVMLEKSRHPKPVMFEFANAMDSPCPSACKMRRSEFDDILFRNAARKQARQEPRNETIAS